MPTWSSSRLLSGQGLDVIRAAEPGDQEAVRGEQAMNVEQELGPVVCGSREGRPPQIRSNAASRGSRPVRSRVDAVEVKGALLDRGPAVGKQGRTASGRASRSAVGLPSIGAIVVPAPPARPSGISLTMNFGTISAGTGRRCRTAVVSGSGGLVGSESVRRLVEAGWDVIGLENDMRAEFFGPEASTRARERASWSSRYPEFRWLEVDIRDAAAVERAFSSSRRRSSWSSTPPPSPRTTGRPASRRPTSP